MKLWKVIKPFMVKYSPEILTGLGIASFVLSIYETGKASYKTGKKIKDKNLSKKDIFKECWKDYIPAVLTLISGTICILGSVGEYNKRTAIAYTAVTMSEAAYEELKEATKEVVGEKKLEEIEHQVSENKVKSSDAVNNTLIVNDGEFMFMDSLTGRVFKAPYSKIEKEANYLNSSAIESGSDITLSEWFAAIGLDNTAESDYYGWSISKNGKKGLIDIYIDSVMYNDRPICYIRYTNKPKLLY